jgi:hypothetical protein
MPVRSSLGNCSIGFEANKTVNLTSIYNGAIYLAHISNSYPFRIAGSWTEPFVAGAACDKPLGLEPKGSPRRARGLSLSKAAES